MKKDIENRIDIQLLVNQFYQEVVKDEMIGPVFTNKLNMNWSKHIPIMCQFWENALFYTGSYSGNPMELHQALHKKVLLSKEHFIRWTEIFNSTVDLLFCGEKANLAKQKALSLSTVMQIKILHQVTNLATIQNPG